MSNRRGLPSSYSPIEYDRTPVRRRGDKRGGYVFESPGLDYSREATEDESLTLFESRQDDSLYTEDGDFSTSKEMNSRTYDDSVVSETETSTQNSNSAFLKHIIYGGLDGVLTTFAIVAGGVGGQVGTRAILLLSLSNIAADALNMGLGDALSAVSHKRYVLAQYIKQKRRLLESRSREVNTVTDIYTAKGLNRRHARAIVEKMAKYDSLFVQTLMMEKLRLQPPGPTDDAAAPWTDGMITFFSFGIWSLIPTLVHCVLPSILYPSAGPTQVFHVTCGVTLALLFGLGVGSSFFSPKSSLRCGAEFVAMGALVLIVAYVTASHVGTAVRWQYPRLFSTEPGS